MIVEKIISVVAAFTLAPLMLGVISRTKAIFAGRRGQPLCQAYFDLSKLLKKGAVYSRTTSWVFKAGPVIGLAACMTAVFLVPFGHVPASIFFSGDFILIAYLLSLGRFFTVLAALDTGSSFEGMGASREVTFSMLAEPTFFLVLFALARSTGGLSLTDILSQSPPAWQQTIPLHFLLTVAMFVVLLAENSRIPFDDPNTHLELTMIHEVIVLDHSGPDLAFIHYGSSLKLWLMGAVLLGIVTPVKIEPAWLSQLVYLGGMAALAVTIGVVESIMARLRLSRVPPLLIGAAACSLFALLLVFRGRP